MPDIDPTLSPITTQPSTETIIYNSGPNWIQPCHHSQIYTNLTLPSTFSAKFDFQASKFFCPVQIGNYYSAGTYGNQIYIPYIAMYEDYVYLGMLQQANYIDPNDLTYPDGYTLQQVLFDFPYNIFDQQTHNFEVKFLLHGLEMYLDGLFLGAFKYVYNPPRKGCFQPVNITQGDHFGCYRHNNYQPREYTNLPLFIGVDDLKNTNCYQAQVKNLLISAINF